MGKSKSAEEESSLRPRGGGSQHPGNRRLCRLDRQFTDQSRIELLQAAPPHSSICCVAWGGPEWVLRPLPRKTGTERDERLELVPKKSIQNSYKSVSYFYFRNVMLF